MGYVVHSRNPLEHRLRFAGRAFCVVALSLSLVGCSSGPKAPPKPKVRRDWFYPTRQHAPEPVYNQLMEVRPPEPIPEPPRSVETAPRLQPVIQVNLYRSRLSEVAKVLGQSYRYQHYCSPLVGDKRVSIRALGTLDELAAQVAKKAGVEVSVDHEHREVRILGDAGGDYTGSAPSEDADPEISPQKPSRKRPVLQGSIGSKPPAHRGE